MPDELRPVKARVLSLRITVPADIYNSGIKVEVKGIDVQIRLEPPALTTKREATQVSSNNKRHTETSDQFDDHIPTAQELAESFLHQEPEAGPLPGTGPSTTSECSKSNSGRGGFHNCCCGGVVAEC